MHSRRATLAGLATLLAGCSTTDAPADGETVAPERGSTAAPTTTGRPQTTTAPHREYLSAFGDSVEETDVVIEDLQLGPAREVVSLSYETARTDYDALGSEIGTLSGLYFRQVRAGWTAERLDATVFREGDDAPIATWHAEAAWFEAYERGDLTADELSLRVLETLARA